MNDLAFGSSMIMHGHHGDVRYGFAQSRSPVVHSGKLFAEPRESLRRTASADLALVEVSIGKEYRVFRRCFFFFCEKLKICL